MIYALSSKNSINSSGSLVTIDAGTVIINAGDGNDYIYNVASSMTVNAGAGDDFIYNVYGHYSKVDAGKGDDSIINYRGSNVSINASKGNDIVSLSS